MPNGDNNNNKNPPLYSMTNYCLTISEARWIEVSYSSSKCSMNANLWPFYSIRKFHIPSPLFLHLNCISFCFFVFILMFCFNVHWWNGYYNIPDRHELWMFNVHSSVTDYWRCNLPRDSVFDILIYLNAPFTCFTAFDFDICRLSMCVWNFPKKKIKYYSSLLENVYISNENYEFCRYDWTFKWNDLQILSNNNWTAAVICDILETISQTKIIPQNGTFHKLQIIFVEGIQKFCTLLSSPFINFNFQGTQNSWHIHLRHCRK